MPKSMCPPTRIAIVTHPSLPEAAVEAEEIRQFLLQLGVAQVTAGRYPDPALREAIRSGQFDLLIAVGGDGTMLRTGHLAAPLDIPVLGINMGRFGFLMEVQRQDWRERLPLLLAGSCRLEQRMMLYARHLRGGQLLGSYDVINEVVVTRGAPVRPVELVATVDGQLLATYVADALIASTPTGSSAYALAAGGPIMPPELHNMLIVPVAPHLSVDRAVIIPEGAVVTITVYTDHEAVFSVDGQPPIHMQDSDSVEVNANRNHVSFVRFQDPGYFYHNIMTYMQQNPAAGNSK